jgi:hypothetical protein
VTSQEKWSDASARKVVAASEPFVVVRLSPVGSPPVIVKLSV